MSTEAIEKFIENLKIVIEKPPYLIFLFVSSIFVFLSIGFGRNFDQSWIFFIYSVAGSIWRYIERDIMHNTFKKNWFIIGVIISYHIGNVLLFFALIKYLNLI